MLNFVRRSLLLVAPLALLAGPAHAADSASDTGSDLFKVLGDFVSNGLGPARTMEEIQREERAAGARALAAQRAAEDVSPVQADKPSVAVAPTPAEVAAPVFSVPAKGEEAPPKVKLAKVEPAKPIPVEVKAAASDIIPPPPRPRPQTETKVAVVPALPPEPLKSPIAATATVEQAIRLGGRSDLYNRPFQAD